MPVTARKRAKDLADFQGAKGGRDRAASLETMMRLALHATVPAMRGWAAKWLLEKFNVKVMPTENERPRHATPAPSNDIR